MRGGLVHALSTRFFTNFFSPLPLALYSLLFAHQTASESPSPHTMRNPADLTNGMFCFPQYERWIIIF